MSSACVFRNPRLILLPDAKLQRDLTIFRDFGHFQFSADFPFSARCLMPAIRRLVFKLGDYSNKTMLITIIAVS